MTAKTLKPSTIIPPQLYVHRDADRQLRRGIEDMGRPAYVLVARQMGKTNLLLNARRELEHVSDAFIYLDLSNTFTSVREFFRNIVDTALQTRADRFRAAMPYVERLRNMNLSPHKEHELELVELLRAIPGRLVVILDEIDALTALPFSDTVFAQIRSTYFSRANLDEFQRLTYILSGVAEPSELIKNPKLSPFNIGEKIYLDDFTYDEFESLVAKAALPIDDTVKLQVYAWANGHPRITWDLLSKLEDVTQLRSLTVADVDAAVNELYLSAFDRAPIDHIRSLAEESAEVRGALELIRSGSGETVSDATRTRLYLAGIISSRGSPPRVKNRLIDESLSSAWLKDVEAGRLGLFGTGAKALERGDHKAAVKALEAFLTEAGVDIYDRLLAIDYLSQAHFSTGQYARALELLETSPYDKAESAKIYNAQRDRAGRCCLYLGRYERSVELFKEVLDSTTDRDFVWRQVSTNLATAYFLWKPAEFRDEILTLYSAAVAERAAAEGDDERHLRVLTRHNLAAVYNQFGDRASAIAEMESALAEASAKELPLLNLGLSDYITEPERKKALVGAAVEAVVTGNVKPVETANITLDLSPIRFGELLAAAFVADRDGAFQKLVAYVGGAISGTGEPQFVLDPLSAATGIHTESPESLGPVVRAVLRQSPYTGSDLKLEWLQSAVARAGQSEFAEEIWGDYLALLTTRDVKAGFTAVDVGLCARRLASLIRDERLEAAVEIRRLLRERRDNVDEKWLMYSDYLRMIAAQRAGEWAEEQEAAGAVLRNPTADEDVGFLSAAQIEAVKRTARAAAASSQPGHIIQNVRTRRYGRNQIVSVRYRNGREVRAKYKKVEADVTAGLCVVVE